MTEKTAVVTGASTGIGKEIARGLAKQGYRVFMVSRDPGRAAAALEDVKKGGAKVESIVADLSLLSEAKRVVTEIKARTQRLHLLINNAAVVPNDRKVTSEGFEQVFSTNVLSVFALTVGLEDLLAAAAPSRVINFYGGNHREVHLDDLQSERGAYNGWNAYGQSKLCDALLTLEFSKRLAAKKITVNSAWPGIVNTEGMRALGGSMKWFSILMRPFMRSAPEGAKTPLWLSTSSEVEGVSGKAFGTMFGDGKKELELPPDAKDPEKAKKLFEICEGFYSASKR
jgi:NAD(P)-dependent dehydrogenase (short-subunit alcohol dehydrogenase family)